MSARSLNKVMLIGNLTRDPEIRYTNSGTPVATFGMATNKSWKNPDGELQEIAEFHNIVAWNKMAEICQQILAKGMKVYIEGSLTTRSWEDEETGVKKYKTEVRVNDMILLDSKGKQGVGGGGGNAGNDDKSNDSGGNDNNTTNDDKDKNVEEPLDDPTADDDLPF